MKKLYQRLKELTSGTDLNYVVPFIVTYFFVIVFLIAKIVVAKNDANDEIEKNLFFYIPLVIDAIVPSTIAYVIGCNINNLIEQRKNNQPAVINLMTMLFVMFYTVLYVLYISFSKSWFVIITSVVFTFIILILNRLSYYESTDEIPDNKRTFSR